MHYICDYQAYLKTLWNLSGLGVYYHPAIPLLLFFPAYNHVCRLGPKESATSALPGTTDSLDHHSSCKVTQDSERRQAGGPVLPLTSYVT